MVTRNFLFYNPKDRACRLIQKKLKDNNLQFHLLDATSKSISSNLYRDMRITTLPALYSLSNSRHKVYQGYHRIESFIDRSARNKSPHK